MFWFKRKKIVVDAFVKEHKYIKYAPIDKASKFFPQWFKDTPSTHQSNLIFPTTTIRLCNGVIDMYKAGLMLPLWTDIAVQVENKILQSVASDGETFITMHDPEQWKTFVNPQDFGHMKIESPWALHTKEDIQWIFQKPFWSSQPEDPIIITPGVINYKYQSATNINIFVNLKTNFNKILQFKEPIIQIIPLTEKEIIIKHQVVNQQEWNKYKIPHPSFINSYKKSIDSEKANKKKCPFGFGSK